MNLDTPGHYAHRRGGVASGAPVMGMRCAKRPAPARPPIRFGRCVTPERASGTGLAYTRVVDQEQRILLTQASPGMVLARPVRLPNKVTLCPSGATLDDALILRLMNRGIKRVMVLGASVPQLPRVGVEETMRAVRERFSRVRDLPLMHLLEKLVEDKLVRRS
ncbi:MAG TPA: hypothetical protein VEL07_22550 [Planctomycetota bacterium]|nr:hypothetical protein [Planctomycetota bacterium]